MILIQGGDPWVGPGQW